jgi:hypothetical protein
MKHYEAFWGIWGWGENICFVTAFWAVFWVFGFTKQILKGGKGRIRFIKLHKVHKCLIVSSGERI